MNGKAKDKSCLDNEWFQQQIARRRTAAALPKACPRVSHKSRRISDLSKLSANSSSYFPAYHATIMVRLILTGYCNTQRLRLTQRDLPAEALKVSALHHRKRNSVTSWKQEQ